MLALTTLVRWILEGVLRHVWPHHVTTLTLTRTRDSGHGFYADWDEENASGEDARPDGGR